MEPKALLLYFHFFTLHYFLVQFPKLSYFYDRNIFVCLCMNVCTGMSLTFKCGCSHTRNLFQFSQSLLVGADGFSVSRHHLLPQVVPVSGQLSQLPQILHPADTYRPMRTFLFYSWGLNSSLIHFFSIIIYNGIHCNICKNY